MHRTFELESDKYVIVGASPAMCGVWELVERLADSALPVLITGETGVGKELIARALHALSKRARGPFVALNCAAVAKELQESELFGHERGAFTGATNARKGAFELADGGTIFLDEVGEMDVKLQPKLLRVLDQPRLHRVGAERSIAVDVRVVSATNRNLAEWLSEALGAIAGACVPAPNMGFDLLAPEYFSHPDNQGVTRRLRNVGEVARFGETADAVRGQLESLGYDVEVWTPSRLTNHYLKTEWRGRNDKYVVTATPGGHILVRCNLDRLPALPQVARPSPRLPLSARYS